VTSLQWSTACPDWRDRIKQGRSLMPCAPLFPAEAEAGMQVFRSLRAVGVPNPAGGGATPLVGEICGQWAQEIAAAIHGAYDSQTGERLIREVFLKVPKKNWKSGWAAMVMLSLSVRNWRESNEAAIIAPTKDGADNVFKPMRDAIRTDPEMSELFHVQPNLRTVTHRVTGMSCRVYAADTDTTAGKIWAFVILEELWQLAKRAGAEDMILEALGGQASRPEGVVISITTEADEEPVGVYKAKLEFARKVRDGSVEAPWFLPILYEWPEDMLKSKAYMDPENFPLVNPNYGASVDPVDMRRKFDEAKEAGDKALRLFLAKRLNVPPSENMGGSWAGAAFWPAQTDETLTFESLLDRCEVVDVGIDGGGLDDLLGLAVLGREAATGKWLLWIRAWAHPSVLERRKAEAPRFRDFAADGDLVLVEQIGDDVAEIADIVSAVEASGKLDKVGLDPSGVGAILDALVDAGVPQAKVVGVTQGWKLNGAIKTFERRLAERGLLHAAQKLMAWCVGNAKVEPRGNAIVITKQASGTAKIDPVMAALNAIFLLSMNPPATGDMAGFFARPVAA
jgi:phage terminase large subunit-like protein